MSASLCIPDDVDARDYTETLQAHIAYFMPDLPIDRELTDTINEELLPFVNSVIGKTNRLEEKKVLIFAGPQKSVARQNLLATMDVHFESVQDILTSTLVQPAEQFSDAFLNLVDMTGAVYVAGQQANPIDQFANIHKAFHHFDKIAAVCEEVRPDLLPSWLRHTNEYYQQLKQGISDGAQVSDNVVTGLGAFFNYAVSFIPQTVSHLFII